MKEPSDPACVNASLPKNEEGIYKSAMSLVIFRLLAHAKKFLEAISKRSEAIKDFLALSLDYH